jgi:hypothetical protein
MSRVVAIGGSGHVGTYLIPALMECGHEIVNVSRGQARSYQHHSAWNRVKQVVIDRTAEEKAGVFGSRIVDLHPDIVVDMISFDLASTQGWARTLPQEAEAGGGLMMAIVQLAIMSGAVAGGILFDTSGYRATFGASSALLVVAAVLAILVARISHGGNVANVP